MLSGGSRRAYKGPGVPGRAQREIKQRPGARASRRPKYTFDRKAVMALKMQIINVVTAGLKELKNSGALHE